MNMDLGAISARAGAPNDGLKKGPDDNTRVPASASEVALWSKQNSDATGMRYQWGRKDPFTFATSSENWGSYWYENGMYPVKLYNGNSVLIYQVDNGAENSGKFPSGGVLAPGTAASSMSVVVANPITFYWGDWNPVIDQSGQSGDLYNYYWTSYSRGTDGQGAWNVPNKFNWHNLYLDSYIPLRYKSIYDPCPYGYRIPSNGTYNQFANPGWFANSYVGGMTWTITSASSWISNIGYRMGVVFEYSGTGLSLCSSTIYSENNIYTYIKLTTYPVNVTGPRSNTEGGSVRCIEECELLPDATEASAGVKKSKLENVKKSRYVTRL